MKFFTRLTQAFVVQPAVNDDYYVARQAALRKRQQELKDQMLLEGTHIFVRRDYKPGDSRVFRDAGLIK